MDFFVSRRHLINAFQSPCLSQALSPMAPTHFHALVHPPSTNFPMILTIVIGMFATSLFLIGYYIFVAKCCLNLNCVHLIRVTWFSDFSLSSQRGQEPVTSIEPRGLEEAVIRSIPVIHYNKSERDNSERLSFCEECAVCLSEFQEDEKLRVIPNCRHVFHIDCIDTWLQNNVNCPLCRNCISLITISHVDQTQNNVENENYLIGGDGDFVVIDLDEEHDEGEQNLQGRKERGKELEELPEGPSQRKLEQRTSLKKKARKLHKVTSMEDGVKDGEFSVQPMRRSFSMDSSLYEYEVCSIEACGGGRAKRSCFSFGPGIRSTSAVILPVYLDP